MSAEPLLARQSQRNYSSALKAFGSTILALFVVAIFFQNRNTISFSGEAAIGDGKTESKAKGVIRDATLKSHVPRIAPADTTQRDSKHVIMVPDCGRDACTSPATGLPKTQFECKCQKCWGFTGVTKKTCQRSQCYNNLEEHVQNQINDEEDAKIGEASLYEYMGIMDTFEAERQTCLEGKTQYSRQEDFVEQYINLYNMALEMFEASADEADVDAQFDEMFRQIVYDAPRVGSRMETVFETMYSFYNKGHNARTGRVDYDCTHDPTAVRVVPPRRPSMQEILDQEKDDIGEDASEKDPDSPRPHVGLKRTHKMRHLPIEDVSIHTGKEKTPKVEDGSMRAASSASRRLLAEGPQGVRNHILYWLSGPAGSGKSTVAFAIALYDSFLRRDRTRAGPIEIGSVPAELESMFIVDGDDYRDCSMNYQRVLKYARETGCGSTFHKAIKGKVEWKSNSIDEFVGRGNVVIPVTWDSIEMMKRNHYIAHGEEVGMSTLVIKMNLEPWDAQYVMNQRLPLDRRTKIIEPGPFLGLEKYQRTAWNEIRNRANSRFNKFGKPYDGGPGAVKAKRFMKNVLVVSAENHCTGWRNNFVDALGLPGARTAEVRNCVCKKVSIDFN